jgi:hypothetical protein
MLTSLSGRFLDVTSARYRNTVARRGVHGVRPGRHPRDRVDGIAGSLRPARDALDTCARCADIITTIMPLAFHGEGASSAAGH